MAALHNLIGGNHMIDQNVYALSFVRKLAADHAYLILETIDENGARKTFDAHLVIKEGSGNTKADIVFREISLQNLGEVAEGCHSITWNISRLQSVALRALIDAEKARANQNLINYILFGKSSTSGFITSASKASGSDDYADASKDSVQDIRLKIDRALDDLPEDVSVKYEGFKLKAGYISMESVDMLFREGHNCASWAIAMLKAIQLDYDPGFLKTLVIVNPNGIVNGNHQGENLPNTHCVIF